MKCQAKHRGISLALVAIPVFIIGVNSQAGVSYNTGSLGATADGTDSDQVRNGPAGAIKPGNDSSAGYDKTVPTKTTVPYLSALNPPSASPFTVEFWASPSTNDSDGAMVSNGVIEAEFISDRSGWVFYHRTTAATWNFKMLALDGRVGWNLTGGAAGVNSFSHVVATWDGNAAKLFVNGVLADDTNDPSATGTYKPNVSENLLIGLSNLKLSAFDGLIDEVAFYATALTPAQIQNHRTLASSPTAGAYFNQVRADGALLQLSNNVPEPSSLLLLGAGHALLLRRRK
jgi:hypothetical protein